LIHRKCSRSALSRFFGRHGITFKKGLRAVERNGADVVRARRRWIPEQGWLDTTRLVFIDETAVTTNMLRLNGWNPRGERLFADAPMGHWETVTFIAGLRQTRIVAPMLIKGAMNGEAFLAYVEQCLAPTLKRGDIVVADNVPFHKVAGVEKTIRGTTSGFWTNFPFQLNPPPRSNVRANRSARDTPGRSVAPLLSMQRARRNASGTMPSADVQC
jgi:DDE superfamily endonuclease